MEVSILQGTPAICPPEGAYSPIESIGYHPNQEEWQAKFMEYAEMAKRMGIIRYQEESVFIKEWGCYVDYLKNHCEQLNTLAGLI